jgi:O-antigen/teichoic acid export membrane protein
VSEHGSRAARSLIWTALESFGLSGLSFLSLIILSRFLSAAEFGAAAIVLGLIQILNLFVEITFHDALVQRREVEEKHFDTAFTVNLIVAVAISATCFLGADAFAAVVGEPSVAPLLGPMSLSLPAMGFAASLIARQRREMEFRPLAIRSLAGRAGGAVLAIAAAVAGAGAWALVVQQVASVAFASAVLWAFATHRPRLRFSREAFGALIGFGVRTTSVNVVFFSIQRLFVIGVGSYLGAAAAGYVTLAFRCVDMLRDLAAGAILQLSLPLFSRLQDDRAELERHYVAAVELSAATMFPVFVGLAVTAPEAVELLFGAKWLPAAPYVALLALLAVQYFTRMFGLPLMSALGRPHYSLVSGLTQLLCVAIGLVTVGRLSADWAMTVWVIRLVVAMPIDLAMLKRVSGISRWHQIRGALPILGIALAMAAVVLVVKAAALDLSVTLRLPAMVATGVATYALLLWTFRRALVERTIGLALATIRRTPA